MQMINTRMEVVVKLGDNMINDMNAVNYVLHVNGIAVSGSFTDKMLAELARNALPEQQRMLAEVVAVTADGKQLLMG